MRILFWIYLHSLSCDIMGMRKAIFKTIGVFGYVIQYGCIAHCTLEYVGDFVMCSGPSMEPTINSKDILLTNRISVSMSKVQKGDIVIARSPTNPHYYICKRITAVEGDKVCEDLTASYKTHKFIPRGHVWLEGDNKGNSSDSRSYGPVPYGLIRSKVFFKLWPVNEAGFIKNINNTCKDKDSKDIVVELSRDS